MIQESPIRMILRRDSKLGVWTADTEFYIEGIRKKITTNGISRRTAATNAVEAVLRLERDLYKARNRR